MIWELESNLLLHDPYPVSTIHIRRTLPDPTFSDRLRMCLQAGMNLRL